MVSPSFQIGQQVGNNFGKAFEQVNDQNTIDRIISDALELGDPEAFQDSMSKILSQVSPQNQGNAIKFLEMKTKSIAEKKALQRKQLAYTKLGLDSNLGDALNTQILKGQQRQAEVDEFYPKVPNNNQNMQQPQIMNQENQPNLGENIPVNQPNQVNQQGQQQVGQPNLEQQANQNRFDLSKVSNEELQMRSGSINPQIAKPAEQELKNRRADRLLDLKNKKYTQDERRKDHQESAKYDEKLSHDTEVAKKQIETIKDIEKAIKSGNVRPGSMANMFKGMGKIGDKISEALLSGDEATLIASIPQLLEGWKEIFGVRLSDADLSLLSDKLPSIGKSPEANMAVLKVLKKYGDMTLLRSKIARDIKKENNNYRPLGYIDMIQDRFDEMTVPVRIITPAGKEISIPAYKLEEAIKSGGRLKTNDV